MDLYPTYRYHKTEAPEGRYVASADDEPQGDGWCDTPAKFDPAYVAPAPAADTTEMPEAAARAGYVPQRYPTTVFKRGDDTGRVVADFEAHLALENAEPGVWGPSYDPAHKHWGGAPLAAPSDPAMQPSTGLTDEQQRKLYTATVEQIVANLDSVSDAVMLRALRDAEQANPDGPRTTVVKAIKARAAKLAVQALD